MEKIQLSDLRGSEKLKIQAAVLELMEAKGFSLDKDLGIIESQADSSSWIMAFTNKVSAFEDLENIKQKLGVKFKVQITSKSKENFLFRIEGPCEEFIRLGQALKPLQLPSDVLPPRSYTTSTVQPSRSEYQTRDREP